MAHIWPGPHLERAIRFLSFSPDLGLARCGEAHIWPSPHLAKPTSFTYGKLSYPCRRLYTFDTQTHLARLTSGEPHIWRDPHLACPTSGRAHIRREPHIWRGPHLAKLTSGESDKILIVLARCGSRQMWRGPHVATPTSGEAHIFHLWKAILPLPTLVHA